MSSPVPYTNVTIETNDADSRPSAARDGREAQNPAGDDPDRDVTAAEQSAAGKVGRDDGARLVAAPDEFLQSVHQLVRAARALAGSHLHRAHWLRCVDRVESMLEVTRDSAELSEATLVATAAVAHAPDNAALRAITRLLIGLQKAEAALSDIGDAHREPGDDVAWCEKRAADALPGVRAALGWHPAGLPPQLSNGDDFEATIRAAYVSHFGNGSGWLSESGSYFIQGYRAAIAASKGGAAS